MPRGCDQRRLARQAFGRLRALALVASALCFFALPGCDEAETPEPIVVPYRLDASPWCIATYTWGGTPFMAAKSPDDPLEPVESLGSQAFSKICDCLPLEDEALFIEGLEADIAGATPNPTYLAHRATLDAQLQAECEATIEAAYGPAAKTNCEALRQGGGLYYAGGEDLAAVLDGQERLCP